MSCTFCPLPWNSINMRNNGDLRICCNTNSYSPQRGIMRKDDGVPFNAGRDDWNEARNANLLKEVRVSMMKGEWHPECERCRQEEKNGIRSRREYENDDWGKFSGDFTVEKAKEMTSDNGTIDTDKHPIEFIDIRYGNFCNLKCRMCGPTDSHKWYDDFVKLTNKTSYKDTHETIELTKNVKGKWATDQYNWFQNNDRYWESFEKYANTSKKLYIVGGEPLIIEEHFESLKRLVDNGTSHNIQLEYNTNLTNLNSEILKLWEQFKQVRVGASIDGCDSVFDYQRTPARWSAVYKNLKLLNDNENINFKGWFAYTVTPYNVFHLPEFMKWKLTESGLNKFNALTSPRPIVTHHMCHSPKYFNIKVLPYELKLELSRHYTGYKEWIAQSDFDDKVKNNFIKILNGVEKFALSEDYSTEWLPHFIDQTKKLDQIRNQDITEIVPQLKDLFKDNDEQ